MTYAWQADFGSTRGLLRMEFGNVGTLTVGDKYWACVFFEATPSGSDPVELALGPFLVVA